LDFVTLRFYHWHSFHWSLFVRCFV